MPECQALVTVPEKVGNRQSEGGVHAGTVMISARFFVFVYLYLCICICVFAFVRVRYAASVHLQ